MTYSAAIDSVVEMAISGGNRILEVSTGWTKVRENVSMEMPLSEDIRAAFNGNNRLREWKSERTPFDRAEEGYVDDIDKVAISFPRY